MKVFEMLKEKIEDILQDIQIWFELTIESIWEGMQNAWHYLTAHFSRTLFNEKGNKVKMYVDCYGGHNICINVKTTFHKEIFQFAFVSYEDKKECKKIFRTLKRQKFKLLDTKDLTAMFYHKHNYAMMSTCSYTFPVIGICKGYATKIKRNNISIKKLDKHSQKEYNNSFVQKNISIDDVKEVYSHGIFFKHITEEF